DRIEPRNQNDLRSKTESAASVATGNLFLYTARKTSDKIYDQYTAVIQVGIRDPKYNYIQLDVYAGAPADGREQQTGQPSGEGTTDQPAAPIRETSFGCEGVQCPTGQRCYAGTCVSDSCVDPVIFKSDVPLINEIRDAKQTECVDTSVHKSECSGVQVKRYYCSSNACAAKPEACPAGKACVGGKCGVVIKECKDDFILSENGADKDCWNEDSYCDKTKKSCVKFTEPVLGKVKIVKGDDFRTEDVEYLRNIKSSEAIKLLIKILRSRYGFSEAKIEAAYALVDIKSLESISALITASIEEKGNVLYDAYRGLTRLNSPADLQILKNLLKNSNSDEFSAGVIKALANIKSPEAIQILAENLNNGNSRDVIIAASGVSKDLESGAIDDAYSNALREDKFKTRNDILDDLFVRIKSKKVNINKARGLLSLLIGLEKQEENADIKYKLLSNIIITGHRYFTKDDFPI
ncbi:MAG: HEAT repeat domain-containing protein, partial [Candidatus Aenigmarchaeota archaeon]|nr:HEAT repeat domain-containing protein [Candidatus Aenigmarchaeota archaeon]